MAPQPVEGYELYLVELQAVGLGAALGLVLPVIVSGLERRLAKLKAIPISQRIFPCVIGWLVGTFSPLFLVIAISFIARDMTETDVLAASGMFAAILYLPTLFIYSQVFKNCNYPFRNFYLTSLATVLCAAVVFWGCLTSCAAARAHARWGADQSNINAIYKEYTSYESKNGHPPSDLRDLVSERTFSAKSLISPLSPTALQPFSPPYCGPCEYNYIPLPQNAPGELLLVWTEQRHNLNAKYVNILLRSGEIYMIHLSDLPALRDATLAWLRANNLPAVVVPASDKRTTSQPTTSESKACNL
ncbi:MAG: hypothetical protein HZA50_04365 [Planctomycetes bacterium]|nr:hypothetical protein [Planctomycetota bacterium]